MYIGIYKFFLCIRSKRFVNVFMVELFRLENKLDHVGHTSKTQTLKLV